MPEPFRAPLRQSRAVSVGTAFYSRAAALNRKQQWREWSGYLAASAYDDSHEIEYNAIREAAALIDVSPLYKYLVSGPDAQRLVDRVITRDATKLAVGRVYYTSWCNEDGRVVDDGTVGRLDEQIYRWTAADPSLRWFRMNARGLDVEIEDVSERLAALAVQGPLSRDLLEAVTEAEWGDLKYFGRRAGQVGSIAVDVSRTGYTGDLGYEVWVDRESAVAVWDAFVQTGGAYGARPAGMLALDVARIEAGLILIEVDFDSVRRALIPEQSFSPFELGILGRFVDFEKDASFVGRQALEAEQERGGPPRRLVGLELDWEPLEELYRTRGLTPTLDPAASREAVPLYSRGRQVGKATSSTWSPILKQVIALASVDAGHSKVGTRIEVEWTVEARRSRVPATVVEVPFFNPERKTATVDPASTRPAGWRS
jgi:aminomethyltransferase